MSSYIPLKWVGGNRDSSSVIANKRKSALTNDSYITNKLTGTVNPNNVTTGGFNPNLKSATRIDNTAPLYTGLGAAGRSSPKVSQKNVNH
jgi:hypothetical protein